MDDRAGTQRLGRARRLARRADFLAAQDGGRRVSGTSYLMYVHTREGERRGPARLGITVSKKVGNAVVRNRVKRWVRESYRRMSDMAPAGVDVVVIARPSAASTGAAMTAEELRSLLGRATRARR